MAWEVQIEDLSGAAIRLAFCNAGQWQQANRGYWDLAQARHALKESLKKLKYAMF